MITISKGSKIGGRVSAIDSKSILHRLLITSFISKQPITIKSSLRSEDIIATINSLKGLGANIEIDEETIHLRNYNIKKEAICDCNESGSTYRFMAGLISGLGIKTRFILKGRLKDRPMEDLFSSMDEINIIKNDNEITLNGRLNKEYYEIKANKSSQFISGLLYGVVARNEDTDIRLIGNIESIEYINMTVSILKEFGAKITNDSNTISYKKSHISPPSQVLIAEKDWSNAAAFLIGSALTNGKISISGLSMESLQGDKYVLKALENIGFLIKNNEGILSIKKSNKYNSCKIDAKDIPDLVPILALAAASIDTTTTFVNINRLSLKESDRIKSTVNSINALGAYARYINDSIVVKGVEEFLSCTLDSYNDHRIVMLAGIAALNCKGDIKIKNYNAINKSYPSFFEDLKKIGLLIKKEDL